MTGVVVFDLGGVLCHFRPRRRLAALVAETGLAASHVEQVIWRSGLDGRAEQGELTRDETVRELLEALDHRLTEAALIHSWSQAFEPNRAVLKITERLKTRPHVFTNNGPLLTECLASDITAHVDRVICSYQLRARKPEVTAFARLAGKLGLEPSTVTIIDDDLNNCDAARAAGMRALHFVNIDSLACIGPLDDSRA